jgi:hypothetical protein
MVLLDVTIVNVALTARGEGAAAALTGGYHLAFWIAAGLVAVGIAVAGTVLRSGD